MATASEIRAHLLKNNPFRSKIIEVDIEEGVKLEVKVKQPSVAERNAIFSAAKVMKSGEVTGAMDPRTGALAIVYCCREPATDEPIFTVADLDTLIGMPAGSWVDKLAGEVLGLLAEAQDLSKK